jgi:cell division protein FtsW (lipid II flippase)
MIHALRRNTEASLLVLSAVIAIGGYWLTWLATSTDLPPRIIPYTAVFAASYLAAHVAVRRLAPSADPLFVPMAAMLNALGFVLIARIERAEGGDFAAAQARWLVVGVVAFVITLWLIKDLRALQRYRYTALFVGVVLLLLPILPVIGREVNGARLWLKIGPLNFQPAELAKIALVFFFAGYLTERRELLAAARAKLGPFRIPEARHFGPVLLAWGVSLMIMILEKDLGSSLLFFTVFVLMLWISTGRPIYLLTGLGMFAVGAFIAYQLFGHVQTRITIWFHAFDHIDDRGFQLVQSLFALATGGVWGTGLGLGRPDLIPSVRTDFIFSAVGEELGLAGTAAVLLTYALFTARGFGLATRCRDDFSKLVVAGLVATFSVQTFIILGGVTRLIPLTGITLPFMSYGGSSLLSNFILVALLIRASHEVAESQTEAPRTELNLAAGGGR